MPIRSIVNLLSKIKEILWNFDKKIRDLREPKKKFKPIYDS